MLVKLKNIILGLLSLKFPQDLFNGNIKGLFNKRSHTRADGSLKVPYSKKSAMTAAEKLSVKNKASLSAYKCVHCGFWHIGNNK